VGGHTGELTDGACRDKLQPLEASGGEGSWRRIGFVLSRQLTMDAGEIRIVRAPEFVPFIYTGR
jgi:hypothetical protein